MHRPLEPNSDKHGVSRLAVGEFGISYTRVVDKAFAYIAGAQVSQSGHLVFSRGTTLMAVPFSLKQLVLPPGVTPVALVQDVQHPGLFNDTDFSISRNGTLIYETDLAWTASSVSPVWLQPAACADKHNSPRAKRPFGRRDRLKPAPKLS
jgi:hypothetical protein